MNVGRGDQRPGAVRTKAGECEGQPAAARAVKTGRAGAQRHTRHGLGVDETVTLSPHTRGKMRGA